MDEKIEVKTKSETTKSVVVDYDEYQAMVKELTDFRNGDLVSLKGENEALEKKNRHYLDAVESLRVANASGSAASFNLKTNLSSTQTVLCDLEKKFEDQKVKILQLGYDLHNLGHLQRGILIGAVKTYVSKTPKWFLWSRAWSDDVLKFIQSGDIDWKIPKIPEVEKDG